MEVKRIDKRRMDGLSGTWCEGTFKKTLLWGTLKRAGREERKEHVTVLNI